MGKRMVVVGSGAVGRETVLLLAARGDEVLLVQRSSPSSLSAHVRFESGNALDGPAMKRICAGADAVVCCLGLKYDWRVWSRDWPVAMDNLLAACAATGARFVFADNLYMYGPQQKPLQEDLPLTSYGRKPKLRAGITQQWLKAHQAGQVKAVAVRAADFYGPDVATSLLSAFGVARLVTGKAALSPFPPDHPHDFTYVPDFARALVSLIDAEDDAYGQAWHVPNAPTRSLRELLTLAAQRIGVPAKVSVLPRAASLLLGLFQRELRELDEMRFQWERPYRVDSSKFSARFWSNPTPFEQGLEATIAFYRANALGTSRGSQSTAGV